MHRNFSQKTALIKARRNPSGLRNLIVTNESLRIAEDSDISTKDDIHEYVHEAMYGVSDSYTKKTKDTGEEVKSILVDALPNATFKYQGSVMTDTHIKGASDIDLLCLEHNYKYRTDFGFTRYFPEMPELQMNRSRNAALKALSLKSCRNIEQKSKSIAVTLDKGIVKVDVVNGIWDAREKLESNRAVSIFSARDYSMVKPDYPLFSINRINDASARTNGRLKRMIRFLKNLKEDADSAIDLTSFEINAICYGIPIERYKDASCIQLVNVLTCEIWNKFIKRDAIPSTIKSVTGVEYPFVSRPSAVREVVKLYNELFPIWETLHNQKEF